MSPTSYQTAPPRECMIAEAEWFVKRGAQFQQRRKLIARSACLRFGDLARANFFQAGSQIFGIDSRGKTNGSIILIVTEQKLFRFALLAQRAADPFFHGGGDHGAPQFLFGCFFDFRDSATWSLTSSPLVPLVRPDDSLPLRWPHALDKGNWDSNGREDEPRQMRVNSYRRVG